MSLRTPHPIGSSGKRWALIDPPEIEGTLNIPAELLSDEMRTYLLKLRMAKREFVINLPVAFLVGGSVESNMVDMEYRLEFRAYEIDLRPTE